MKLTLKHIGILSVLFFNIAHATAPAEATVLKPCAETSFAAPTGEAIKAIPTEEVVIGEVVKQPTPLEEINKNLSEVKAALKDGIQAVAIVANSIVDTAAAVLNIARGTVKFAVSIATVTMCVGYIAYIAANALVEFSQTTFASK